MEFLTPARAAQAGRPLDDLRRAAASGELVRLRRGVYLPAEEWSGLTARRRHVALVRAQTLKNPSGLVVSHLSAGALWGLPVLDEWPPLVHAVDLRRSTTKTTTGLVRHASSLPTEPHRIEGVPVTSLPRTVVDVGLQGGFLAALLAADYALAQGLASLDELRAELRLHWRARGSGEVRAAFDLAHPGSKSAGESISKGQIHLLGFERPELQKEFLCPGARTFLVDFWWAGVGCIGEFDGEVKYRDPRMRGGRSLEQVILDEKSRSDALMALPNVRNLARWNYATARHPAALAELLTTAGVPRLR